MRPTNKAAGWFSAWPRPNRRQQIEPKANIRSITSQEPLRHSIRMTADRMLVVPPKDHERRTRGGIVIPATAVSEARRAMWGEVVAVGPMVRAAEVGDLVMFGPESAYEVEIRSEEYFVLRERDIHAVASERQEGKTGLYL